MADVHSKEIRSYNMSPIEIFLMTDQPVTCPLCGTRAEIMIGFELDNLPSQLCNCSNAHCRFVFIEQEDNTNEY